MNVIFISLLLAYIQDCNDVINLALAMNINTVAPGLMTQIRSDCCGPSIGIECADGRVIAIDWSYQDLIGFINGTALPSKLERLSLDNNYLTGGIPSVLPDSLLSLSLMYNRLTGGLPSIYPSNITSLNVCVNKLSGNVPKFPDTLSGICLGYGLETDLNRFSGTLELVKPDEIIIINNYITNIIIHDSSKLVSCDISHNPLLEHINDPGLASCFNEGLYSAFSLPITLSTTVFGTSTLRETSTSSSLSIILSSDLISQNNRNFGSVSFSELNSIFISKTKRSSASNSLYSSKQDSLASQLNSRSSTPRQRIQTTSIQNVAPYYKSNMFQLSAIQWILIVVRLIINMAGLRTAVHYTPFKREWKRTSVSTTPKSNILLSVIA
eukprot:NODE_397_length_9427_cov_0.309605.p2 type:complete len:382 gc:universal NODE_397_length_9427_cov_0.309605:1871-3016(+)